MKQTLFNILYWALSNLDRGRLKALTIDLETKVKVEAYLPNDKDWHMYAQTVTFWVKRGESGTVEKIDNMKIYVDGGLRLKLQEDGKDSK